MLSFEHARERVVQEIIQARSFPLTEIIALDAAPGRVLAAAVHADRDYPALNRSVRDGFAVRSADVPGELEIVGESRAGGAFAGTLAPGQAAQAAEPVEVASSDEPADPLENKGSDPFAPAA